MFNIEKDWITKSGLRAVVIMSHSYRCGYVGVPATHPLYKIEYNEQAPAIKREDVDHVKVGKRGVMVTLTATVGADTEDSIRRSPDILCNVHGGLTYSGKGDYPVAESGLWWFGFDTGHFGDDNVSLEYCIDECESLAEQLEAIK